MWQHKLFAHKITMHRKWVSLKCASHMLHDALFMFQFLSFMLASLSSSCLARKGIKEKLLLADNPIFTLTVFVCSHDYSTVVIMFYSFCFNKVPSRTFGKTLVKSLWSCCKKTETLALTRLAAIFYWRVILGWFFLKMINR